MVQGMSEGTLGVFFQLEALPRDGGFHFCSPGRTGQGGVVETPGQGIALEQCLGEVRLCPGHYCWRGPGRPPAFRLPPDGWLLL